MVAENNYYKQQLANLLSCNCLTTQDFNYLKYNKNDIVKILSQYFECSNQKWVSYNNKETKNLATHSQYAKSVTKKKIEAK